MTRGPSSMTTGPAMTHEHPKTSRRPRRRQPDDPRRFRSDIHRAGAPLTWSLAVSPKTGLESVGPGIDHPSGYRS